MPLCLVHGCFSSWRTKDKAIKLHTFPRDRQRIRIWLHMTGQFVQNLEEMVELVWLGKVNDNYRLCSKHFSNDAYTYIEDKRKLRPNAIPTIFPQPAIIKPQLEFNARNQLYFDSSKIVSCSPTFGPVTTSTTNVLSYTIAATQASTNLTSVCFVPNFLNILPSASENFNTQTPNLVSDTEHSSAVPKSQQPQQLPKDAMCFFSTLESSQVYADYEIEAIDNNFVSKTLSTDEESFPVANAIGADNPLGLKKLTRDFATNTLSNWEPVSRRIQVNVPKRSKKIMCHLLKSPIRKCLKRTKSKQKAQIAAKIPLINEGSKTQSLCNVDQAVQVHNNGIHSMPIYKNVEVFQDPNTMETNDACCVHMEATSTVHQTVHDYCAAWVARLPTEPACSADKSVGLNRSNNGSLQYQPDIEAATSIDVTIEASTTVSSTVMSSKSSDDSTFQPSETDIESISSWDSEHITVPDSPADFEMLNSINPMVTHENKYIVFESALKKLLTMIPCPKGKGCGCPLIKFKKIIQGSLVRIHVVCTKGHIVKLWQSQPIVQNIPAGNLLISASIVLSGNSFQKINSFLGVMNLKSIGKTAFFRQQHKFIYPGIDLEWRKEVQNVRENMQRQCAFLAGDGQCDSPGYSAKYCTYTLMDIQTEKICAFSVEQVSPTCSSNTLEKTAFKKTLHQLNADNITIGLITTDRHVSVRKILHDEYAHINQQFDVWHVAKSIGNKILSVSKTKKTAILNAWIQPIKNHLWYCARTCSNDPEILITKWKALLKHIINVHTWEENGVSGHCEHKVLTELQLLETKWLEPTGPAFNAISKIVDNPTLLKDLHHLTAFCHTGSLEIYHSLCLKYRPKRIHYFMDSMVARTQLAAIDHNRNIGRRQATVTLATATGKPVGALRHRVEFSKGRRAWIVKNLYEPTSQTFLIDILDKIFLVASRELQSTWCSQRNLLPKNIAPFPKPNTDQLIQEFNSRFARQDLPP